MSTKNVLQQRSVAGQKLLGAALIRNAESVSHRYRDKATRALCQQVKAAGEQLIELAGANVDCALGVYWQPELPIDDDGQLYPF